MNKCARCRLELEKHEELLCAFCAELPTCKWCGIIDTKLCDYCKDREVILTEKCVRCEEKIENTDEHYKEYGNFCALCDQDIEDILEKRRLSTLK